MSNYFKKDTYYYKAKVKNTQYNSDYFQVSCIAWYLDNFVYSEGDHCLADTVKESDDKSHECPNIMHDNHVAYLKHKPVLENVHGMCQYQTDGIAELNRELIYSIISVNANVVERSDI